MLLCALCYMYILFHNKVKMHRGLNYIAYHISWERGRLHYSILSSWYHQKGLQILLKLDFVKDACYNLVITKRLVMGYSFKQRKDGKIFF